MACTTSRREPIFTWAEVCQYVKWFRDDSRADWSLDCFPCTLTQFEIIASATFCYKRQVAALISVENSRREATTHKRNLLLQDVPQLNWLNRHLVESYRLGAILYINGLFNLGLDEVETKKLVSSIMALADSLSEEPARLSLLVWPIYQAGLESRGEDGTKAMIRRHFHSIVSATGCRHGQNALNALESYWCCDAPSPRPSIPTAALEGELVLI